MAPRRIGSFRGLIPAALIALVASGAAEAHARLRIAPELASRASREGVVRIIVQLDVPTLPEGRLHARRSRLLQRQRIAAVQNELRAELAGTTYRTARRFRGIGFAALEVGPEALSRLGRSARVVAVQEDRLHRPSLNVSMPLVEADQAAVRGSDGSGQTVVVIDTGVDASHPNLAGKVVDEACFAAGNPFLSGDCPNGEIFEDGEGSGAFCTYSTECFHGTHVAGIAAGAGSAFPGAAQGATLIPIRVFSEFTGSACDPSPSPCLLSYASDQIGALEYVFDTLRPLHAIASVNMSLGGATHTSQALCDADNAATKAAIDNLRSVGIATVIAAGNDGRLNAISEPACISSAVSVSATDDSDEIPSFSNAAAFLSLWAPGLAIRAPLSGSVGFIEASGTSMAAPHVAGAWAMLRQADPSASVDEILTILQNTGLPIPDVHAETSRIRIAQALDALLPDCENGLDDDGDGLIDFDGGAAANGGVAIAEPDPGCTTAWSRSETPATPRCGIGFELALLMPPLLWRFARRRGPGRF